MTGNYKLVAGDFHGQCGSIDVCRAARRRPAFQAVAPAVAQAARLHADRREASARPPRRGFRHHAAAVRRAGRARAPPLGPAHVRAVRVPHGLERQRHGCRFPAHRGRLRHAHGRPRGPAVGHGAPHTQGPGVLSENGGRKRALDGRDVCRPVACSDRGAHALIEPGAPLHRRTSGSKQPAPAAAVRARAAPTRVRGPPRRRARPTASAAPPPRDRHIPRRDRRTA